MRFLNPATALCGLALMASAAAASSQQPFTVYLHPAPTDAALAAPTLDAAQAEAVLSHHMGGAGKGPSAYEKMPSGWGKWVHLLSGEKGTGEALDRDKARVVIVQGNVDLEGK